MTLLLSIETSTPVCSIALHQDGELVISQDIQGEKSHSEQLTIMIEKLLKEKELTYQNLSGVVVSSGPGSYTGLRIGTSTAKGLCFSLDIPLISVSTLEAIAQQETSEEFDLICPMLDARRMEVYCMLLDAQLNEVEKVHAKIMDETSFEEEFKTKKIVFVGDAVEKCKEILTHKNAILKTDIFPSAKSMGKIAFEKYQQQQFEDVAYFEPFYLKSPNITTPKKKVL